MEAELVRYIEYLQRGMYSDRRERTQDNSLLLEWLKANRADAMSTSRLSGVQLDDLELELSKYLPTTCFESSASSFIFQPLLSEVLIAAAKTGHVPARNVIFANSTAASASPLSVPSEGEHLVFAGPGTFAFCNYWAKLVTWLILCHQTINGASSLTSEAVQRVWDRFPELLKAIADFVAYCRTNETAIGYGAMPTPKVLAGFRLELLHSMEYFAIAHEVGHCCELESGTTGAAEEELRCDQYALDVCREIGISSNNFSTHCGAGGLFLLEAAEICQSAPTVARSDSHPKLEVRRSQIIRSLANSTMKSPIESWHYLLDFLVIAQEISLIPISTRS